MKEEQNINIDLYNLFDILNWLRYKKNTFSKDIEEGISNLFSLVFTTIQSQYKYNDIKELNYYQVSVYEEKKVKTKLSYKDIEDIKLYNILVNFILTENYNDNINDKLENLSNELYENISTMEICGDDKLNDIYLLEEIIYKEDN